MLAISRRTCGAGSACPVTWLAGQTPPDAQTPLASESYQVGVSPRVQETGQ